MPRYGYQASGPLFREVVLDEPSEEQAHKANNESSYLNRAVSA